MATQSLLSGCLVPPNFVGPSVDCAAGGGLGVVLLPGGSQCSAQSCDCAVGQTCDTVFGLCQGLALFTAPALTVPPTTGAAATAPSDSSWIVIVAVVVPVVVVLGVAGALLVVYYNRRQQSAYDAKTNNDLKMAHLTALQTQN
jgi:hypothetical protein